MTWADRLANLKPVRWWFLLITAALLIRLVWAAAMAPRQPFADEINYIAQAKGLAAGKGYVDETGRRTAYWPVGYPAVLSVCYRLAGQSQAVNTFLQIALSIATVAILAWVGTAAFGARIGRSAALLLAIYPNHVLYSTLYLTEPLFCFLVLAAMALLLASLPKAGSAGSQVLFLASAGIAAGLGALVRSVLLLFPAVLPLWFWRQRLPVPKLLSRTALVILCTLLAAGPWMVRNHAVTEQWLTISSNGGDNFWFGNYPGALGGYGHPPQVNEGLRVRTGDYESREYSLGFRAIARHPVQAVLRVFQKTSYFFAFETDGVLWNIKGFAHPPLVLTASMLLLANLAYVLVVSLALLGIVRTPGNQPLLSLFLLLTSYLVLVTIVYTGDPRYHYVLLPIALIFAAKGLLDDFPWAWRVFGRTEPGGLRQLAGWGAVVGVFLLLVALNIVVKFLEVRAYVRAVAGSF